MKVTANSPSQSQAVSGERPALGANIDDPVLSTEAFAQRLQIAAVRGHLFRERVALVLVEAGDKDSAQRAQSQLIAALEPRDVLAERAEGGLQALLWNATREKVDKLAGLMVLRGGRKLRLGVAFIPDDASTAGLAADMARCSQLRASTSTPLIYASQIGYVPPERRIIPTSLAIASVNKAIEDLAWTPAPVFLQGEPGSGKEAVARTIHRWSSLRESAFVSVNCEVAPESLIVRLLEATFGEPRPSGVTSDSEGRERLAGTLYFSRVESLPDAARDALVQHFASRDQRDSSLPRAPGARFIFGTSQELDPTPHAIAPQSVLYRKIGGASIRVPPLRERREDLSALVQYYLDDIAAGLGRGPLVLGSDAMRQLLEYPFPGNLPELRYELSMAAEKSSTSVLSADAFSDTVRRPLGLTAGVSAGPDFTFQGFDLRRRVQAFEAQLIVRALDLCDWNQTEAAKRLNVPRRTLVYKMRQLGIRRASSRPR